MYLWRVWRLLGGLIGLLTAQPPLLYKELHRQLFPLVQDTSHREWLPRLREKMQELRRIEWNDRFFREVAQLYLQQSDSLPELLGTIRRYVGVDSARIAALFRPLEDRSAAAASLMAAYEALARAAAHDTSHTGYLLRQASTLARHTIEAWISAPDSPPLALLISGSLRGYFKALAAAYAFFGFDASSEPWPDKMRVLQTIGLLDYYAYGESANEYRAWKRGYRP